MALWPTRAARTVETVSQVFDSSFMPPITDPGAVAAFLNGWGMDYSDFGDYSTEPLISRAAALTVPAVAAGRDLIVDTLAPLPLDLRRGSELLPLPTLLERPDPRTTRHEWLSWLLDDLVMEGQSWQLVTDRDFYGFPRAFERLCPEEVTVLDDGQVIVREDHRVDPQDVKRFSVGRDGIRSTGRRVIRTALRLEQAARADAETPLPPLILRNTGPDLPPDQVRDMLDTWRAARRSKDGSVAYVSQAIEAQTQGWSAADRQLVEARRHVAVEIARLMGLRGADLEAVQSGSSVTYANVESAVRDRLLRLASYRAGIEQRLSMPDITPRGQTVTFNVDAILRSDTLTRFQAYAIGISSGFMSAEDVAAVEGTTVSGSTASNVPQA